LQATRPPGGGRTGLKEDAIPVAAAVREASAQKKCHQKLILERMNPVMACFQGQHRERCLALSTD